jgi:hypothetical protein
MDSQKRRSRSGPAIALLIALFLPVLYVLSVGPATIIFEGASPEVHYALRVFYYPLAWLHENTPLRGPLEAYVEFWIDLS